MSRLIRADARETILAHIVKADAPPGDVDISYAYGVSVDTVPGYATLDETHITSIHKLQVSIDRYARDSTLKRPLNVLMHAEPGTGKSHFVRCLAKSMPMANAVAVDFNMASYADGLDMQHVLDEVRDLKVSDRLPILFLDEFDTERRHYATLLPLMWDGEFRVRQRILKLGKLVVILAGSKRSVTQAIQAARTGIRPKRASSDKLPDLISRINGGTIEIPPLDLRDKSTGRDRRIDKVCIGISLLERRYWNLLLRVPWSLLRFIARTEFRYGVRSIEHLVSLMKPLTMDDQAELTMQQVHLPLGSVSELRESSLCYHLAEMANAERVVSRWQKLMDFENMVTVRKAPKVELPI